MKKKIGLVVCIIAFICTISYPVIIEAEPSVEKCLEEDADCTQTKTTPNDAKSDEESGGMSNGSLLFNLVKMFFALLLVLGLIYLLLKFLSKRNKLFQQVKGLENLGGISVGPNKSIQLVRIGSKIFIIGVGENVEMLQEISEEEAKKEILHNNESNEVQTKSLLTSIFQQKTNADEETQSNKDFKSIFSSELNKLKQKRARLINQRKQKEDRHE
ncbi:flagellar biosynthetic protein FliO [Virgibacillus sp. JSM 102003]|uniref:flagellar biosynthetic protein FliO n=1 Tax=Virgibacillus sp. JSM 102003 TaxID=1562108 RepID=UPI0035C12252